jgi:hypothetical protein
MTTDRRTFLKLAASLGLVMTSPGVLPQRGWADEVRFAGPFLVTIHASGGWDPTLLCDPKGRETAADDDPVNRYATGDIGSVGDIRYAPLAGHREFFERFASQLLVVNGIDAGTNSHDTGTRHIWSGGMDAEMPSIGALAAAAAPTRPALAFLSNGGYDVTRDLVASTRLPDVGAIAEISYPHRLDPNSPTSTLFTDAGLDRIAQARQERLQRQHEAETLPRQIQAMELLMASRMGDNELSELLAWLPATLDNSNNPLIRQAQVAVAAFRAGLSISANLVIGGFDTHGNHDQNHEPAMQRVVAGITALMNEAERQGIADRLVVAVGSDFARTPWYNETNGKDHWSVTSMMFMGPGIRGGRVIGATDARQSPLTIDPSTLAVSEAGIRITPGHVHHSLRELLGFGENPVVEPFRVQGSAIPLFS